MKKTAIIIFQVFLLAIAPNVALSAEKDSPASISETFFNGLKKGNVSRSYDELFVGSSIPSSQPQAVELLKKQTEMAVSLYGEVIGFELVHEERFGNSVVRLVYLLKSELHPTVWEFYFYRPRSEWILSNMKFNDQFADLDRKK